MIKIILTGLAITAIVIFSIIATKLKRGIDDYEGDKETVITELKQFAKYNRYFILSIVFIIILGGSIITNTVISEIKTETMIVKDTTKLDSINDLMCFNRLESLDKENILIDAIAEVESGDNPSCKGGGAMQITKVCVDAANRLQKKVKYEYSDRYSREKSVEIWHIIQNNCNRNGDIERAIRIWNGGPNYTKAGTQAYYEKVMKVYNRMIDEHLNDICKQYKSLNL